MPTAFPLPFFPSPISLTAHFSQLAPRLTLLFRLLRPLWPPGIATSEPTATSSPQTAFPELPEGREPTTNHDVRLILRPC